MRYRIVNRLKNLGQIVQEPPPIAVQDPTIQPLSFYESLPPREDFEHTLQSWERNPSVFGLTQDDLPKIQKFRALFNQIHQALLTDEDPEPLAYEAALLGDEFGAKVRRMEDRYRDDLKELREQLVIAFNSKDSEAYALVNGAISLITKNIETFIQGHSPGTREIVRGEIFPEKKQCQRVTPLKGKLGQAESGCARSAEGGLVCSDGKYYPPGCGSGPQALYSISPSEFPTVPAIIGALAVAGIVAYFVFR